MASVYLALVAGPEGFNKLLVVKVMRDDLMDGAEDAVRMFWSEARLSAQLVHPNIVHTYEVGQEDNHYFLAMEYLDGQTYRTVANRALSSGGLPLQESLRVVSEAARGLHYSHGLKSFKGESLGVVHRDVSPQNVMLTYDGQVKILDFGIAKMRNSEQLTQAGMIKGKLEYVAPEQLKGENLDGRADVFALGVMLWEAITGQRFAGGPTVAEVAKVHARLSGSEPKLRTLKPDTPEALARIVDSAIALDPNDRFETAAAFADAIDTYLATLPVKASAQTLAAFLEPLFAGDRARIHQLIDEQIERSHSGTGKLPQLGGDPASTSGMFLGHAERSASGRTDLREALAQTTQADLPSAPQRGGPKRLAVWGLLGVAILAGTGFALSSGGRPEPLQAVAEKVAAPPAPAPAAAAQVPSPPSAVAAVEREPPPAEEIDARSVLLELKVEPQTARVNVDGAPLAPPFRGRFQKGDSLHMIEAVADGYQPFKRLIRFDIDQVLAIELERATPQQHASRKSVRATSSEKRSEPASKPEPAPVVSSPPAAAAPLEPGGKLGSPVRRRSLIVNDPYATP
jgi:eukaryotic-like serine/threonine-protein kinase